MSLSTSNVSASGSRRDSACSVCRNCCRRDCPYSCDRILEGALRRAASQGQVSAQLLSAEAQKLLNTISCAKHACQLLNAANALERTLSDALHAEAALIKTLSALS